MAGAARRKRANGEESRERILDAAGEIAGERGYEGASIALVSERSGLPASSIYWHFEDKDRLIAAVIERSFTRWLDGIGAWMPEKSRGTRLDGLTSSMRTVARALAESPDFLRLGLMLALERRPLELSARTLFLQVRAQAYERMIRSFETLFGGELDKAKVRALATLTMAAADGLFIAHQIDQSDAEFEASFELLASAILGAAEHLASRIDRSSKLRRLATTRSSRKGR
jgi:AcrR family transcriptional regulator